MFLGTQRCNFVTSVPERDGEQCCKGPEFLCVIKVKLV